ncbi:hypothetical protein RUM43_001741 [Polyplax serrata]|uniref:C2H2-type domain-containing protein n=1 Tax=Polyplax serrata TaxID=468196 RepID=A0AAN8SF82_POLSC
MDLAQKVYMKIEKILTRLKALNIVQTFELKINFCHIEESMKVNLKEIDAVLKKCLKKIVTKPRRAEIRNVINELIRRKNLSGPFTGDEVPEAKSIKESRREMRHILLNVKLKTDSSRSIHRNIPLGSYHKLKKFVCNICGENFSDILQWRIHKRVHETDDEFFICHHCLSTFTSSNELNFHICSHNESASQIEHSRNKRTSPLPSHSKSAELKLDASKNFETKQSSSPKQFKTKKILKEMHTTYVNNSQEQFVCTCGKTFKILKSLRKHESVKHSKSNITYNCTFCSKIFREKGKLNRHMLSHRNNQYQCPQCSKQFARTDTLNRHIKAAHDEKQQFSCSFCKKAFSFKHNRDVHEENIHKNWNVCLQCDQCGQKFKNKLTLKSHMELHSGNRITCSICSKPFTRKAHYKKHLKSKHFGISPYQTLLDSVVSTQELPP